MKNFSKNLWFRGDLINYWQCHSCRKFTHTQHKWCEKLAHDPVFKGYNV